MTQITNSVKSFLNERRFAVVATINKDGTPQLSVLWYELQGDRIMMNTAVGRVKEKNLKRDPHIYFCLEDGYRYVTLKGRAELDYGQERSQADIRALALRYEGLEAAESQVQKTFSKEARVSIYMTIEEVSAHGL